MEPVTALATRRPSALDVIAGERLPAYVLPDQARAMVNVAASTRDRLLLECIWQSGGRISEVLRLRRNDVDAQEGALRLRNLKRRTREGSPKSAWKLVYVSWDLVGQMRAHAHDTHLGADGYFFRSRESGDQPMHRAQAWRIIRAASVAAGVWVADADGPRLAHGRDFRHGAAVNQIRQGVPVSEVQQQLGHSRLDTTAIYLRLANRERRATADRVVW